MTYEVQLLTQRGSMAAVPPNSYVYYHNPLIVTDYFRIEVGANGAPGRVSLLTATVQRWSELGVPLSVTQGQAAAAVWIPVSEAASLPTYYMFAAVRGGTTNVNRIVPAQADETARRLVVPRFQRFNCSDTAIARDIMTVLRSTVVQRMNFRIGSVEVTGSRLEGVARAIADGRILVLVDPDLRIGFTYRPGRNILAVTPGGLVSNYHRAAALHECVHAANDDAPRTLRARDNEAAAYVAQAMYLAACSERPLDPAVIERAVGITTASCTSGDQRNCELAVMATAMRIALEFRAQRTPSEAEINDLRSAIPRYSLYADDAAVQGDAAVAYEGW